MSNFDHLPDDATRLAPANIRSHFTDPARHPTMIGWLGRYALVVPVVGVVVVLGGRLGPVLYAMAQ